MMNELLILITTVPNKSLAEKIGNNLVENNLAACVSFKEINSIYKWKGKLQEEKEFEITIKSTSAKLNGLLKSLKDISSYEVPQLIYKEFDSEISYLKWINESLN
tara:strand:+ start:783 stop:1097 length:315 start_codon:yes stop_codon:yes gene_type:complete